VSRQRPEEISRGANATPLASINKHLSHPIGLHLHLIFVVRRFSTSTPLVNRPRPKPEHWDKEF